MPSEPSITVHFPQLEAAQPVHDERIGLGDFARRLRLAARRMVSPSPRVLPSASANGPDANSTPFFSRPIMYSRWRGKCSAIFSAPRRPWRGRRRAFYEAWSWSARGCALASQVSSPRSRRLVARRLSPRKSGIHGRALLSRRAALERIFSAGAPFGSGDGAMTILLLAQRIG